MEQLILIARNGDYDGWYVKENREDPVWRYSLTQNLEEARQFLPNEPKVIDAIEFWRDKNINVETRAVPLGCY